MPSQLSMRKRGESLILTIIGGSCHKHDFCHNKHLRQNTSLAATKVCLPRQNFCCNKIVCHDKHVFVGTKVLSRQAYFCCDKRCVLSRQTCVCHDKSKLVMTKLLLRQASVTTEHVLCCNKTFVVTKIILVAAPANDI